MNASAYVVLSISLLLSGQAVYAGSGPAFSEIVSHLGHGVEYVEVSDAIDGHTHQIVSVLNEDELRAEGKIVKLAFGCPHWAVSDPVSAAVPDRTFDSLTSDGKLDAEDAGSNCYEICTEVMDYHEPYQQLPDGMIKDMCAKLAYINTHIKRHLPSWWKQ